MADFPIQYSQRLPSGRSTAAPITADVSAPSRALSQLGGSITEIGQDLQNQKNALDYSEGQRLIQEKVNAAYESLTGDEEADKKVWETLQKDMGSVQYKSGHVNNALTQYRNSITPNVQQKLNQRHQAIFKQNMHDGFVANGQTFLAKGDLVGYQNLLDLRLKSKDISMAEYQALSESSLGDSLLQQARDLMASDRAADNYRAIGILENITKVEEIELSTEQKEYRNRMLNLAKKTTGEKSDAAITEVVIQMDNLREKTALEKEAAAQEMKQSLVDGGITGDKLNQYFNIINEWTGGEKDITEEYDPQVYTALQARIDLYPDSLTDAEIYQFVGLGREGGISTKQARALVDLRRRNVDDVGSLQNEVHRRYQDVLKGMYNAGFFGDKEDTEAAFKYADVANKLTVYANKNKDATPEEFERAMVAFSAPEKKRGWLKSTLSWVPPFSVVKAVGVGKEWYDTKSNVRANVERIRGIESKLLKQHAEREAQRVPGTERRGPDGKMWRLVERGKTPSEDIYEEVQ